MRFHRHFQLQGSLPISWIKSRPCNRKFGWALLIC